MMKAGLASNSAMLACCITLVTSVAPSAMAQQDIARRPFTSTLSNTTPLAFGMTAETAAAALGTPLTYVRGSFGNETFVVIRMVNGEGFLFRKDPLYLQFRHGRLTGWKGDWSREWLGQSPLF